LMLNTVLASAQETSGASATDTNNAAGDKAWKEVRKAAQEPMPPVEWQNQKPSREEIGKFYSEAPGITDLSWILFSYGNVMLRLRSLETREANVWLRENHFEEVNV